MLIVASGTSRMDNKKVKALFGGKPKMLGVDEVAEITGHEVGGVCPFGLKTPLPVYCDESLKAFDVVVPAAGSTHSAVADHAMRGWPNWPSAEWVDVCEHPRSGKKRRRLFVIVVRLWAGPAGGCTRLRGPSTRRGLRLLSARGAACGGWAVALFFEHRAATARGCGLFCRKLTPRSRSRPASDRCKGARHRACRPSACSKVPRYSSAEAGF